MNNLSAQWKPHRTKKSLGLVVVLHIVFAFLLAFSLARKSIDMMQKPLETKIIEEAKEIPKDKPPDKPPPPKSLPAPPPPMIAAEVNVNVASSGNAITVNPNTAPVIDAARSCSKPEYPAAAKRLGEEGVVTLRFLVGIDGKVIESAIQKSSGYARLDEAARKALSLCSFRPGTLNGKSVLAWGSMNYVWRLD
jgi:protein TonB